MKGATLSLHTVANIALIIGLIASTVGIIILFVRLKRRTKELKEIKQKQEVQKQEQPKPSCCMHCGSAIKENEKFCKTCGAEIKFD